MPPHPTLRVGGEPACIHLFFVGPDSHCAIYEARPTQCRVLFPSPDAGKQWCEQMRYEVANEVPSA